MRILLTTAFAFALILGFSSCKDSNGDSNNSGQDTLDPDPGPQVTYEPVIPFEVTIDDITVRAPGMGAVSFPDAKLTLNNLEAGADLPEGKYTFDFKVDGYTLGENTMGSDTKGLANSGDGQHIHVILNNEPYMAKYEPKVSVELKKGHYLMTAFLSRSYHESIKTPEASLFSHFTVDGAEEPGHDPAAPTLVYSRPKGTYKGEDAKNILLDFFLFNTKLGAEDNKVMATIDGIEFILPIWQPYIIEGLGNGEHTIKLDLIDVNGAPVDGLINSTTRTIVIQELEDPESM